jgi:hypothetical protein
MRPAWRAASWGPTAEAADPRFPLALPPFDADCEVSGGAAGALCTRTHYTCELSLRRAKIAPSLHEGAAMRCTGQSHQGVGSASGLPKQGRPARARCQVRARGTAPCTGYRPAGRGGPAALRRPSPRAAAKARDQPSGGGAASSQQLGRRARPAPAASTAWRGAAPHGGRGPGTCAQTGSKPRVGRAGGLLPSPRPTACSRPPRPRRRYSPRSAA